MKRFCFSMLLASLLSFLAVGCSDSKPPAPDDNSPENRVYLPDDMEVTAGEKFFVPIYFENVEPIAGVSLSLNYRNDYVRCDSISFINSRVEQPLINVGFIFAEDRLVNIGRIGTTAIDSGTGELARLYFWAFGNAPESDLVIDSVTVIQPQAVVFVDTSLNIIQPPPRFQAGRIHIKSLP